ncbi:hypothetical protein [Paenibacillus luteus]|uniref:hypothetical protein n=1 Tax=Paenibacillus luteus TaxID=2545753 RepID=UPI0019D655B4|nr:hypothetical protein [Paenibacillus luteus]
MWKVEAGDAVGIYGGNLGGPDVEVKAQPLSSTQPLDPSNATVDLEVIKAEDQLVQAIMPNTAPANAYAVWVITAEGASDPFWFNRAEPFWISDTTAYAGQAVRWRSA